MNPGFVEGVSAVRLRKRCLGTRGNRRRQTAAGDDFVFVAGDDCDMPVWKPQVLSTDGQNWLDAFPERGPAGRHRRSEVLHSRKIAILLCRIASLGTVQRIIHTRGLDPPGIEHSVLVLTSYLLLTINDRYGLVAALTGTILVYATSVRLVPRATLFGLSLFPILIYSLFMYASTRERSWLWVIPPVLIVWGNLHGSYLIGVWILGGFSFGLFLEYFFWDHVATRDLVTYLLVLAVLFSGLMVVKPIPDSMIFDRATSLMSGETALFSGGGKMNESEEWSLPSLKNVTHDLFLSDRPYVAPEFSYSLKYVERPDDYVFLFLLLPLLGLYLAFRATPKKIALLFGVLFAFWIGVAFQRAMIYAVLTGGFVLVPDAFPARPSIQSVSEHLALPLRTILAGMVLFGAVWFLEFSIILSDLRSTVGSQIRPYWELGWGRHSYFRSELSRKLLRKYPERKVYNEPSIGGILLYEWWPRKKVFWWPKTSDFSRSILAKRARGGIDLGFLKRNNFTLAVVSTRFAEGAKNPYARSDDWVQVGQDQLLTAYCQCE